MNTKEIIQELSLQFLKGQLNEFELVNRLITSAEKGGAGLSQEQAQKTFDKLLEYKKKLEDHGMKVDQLVSSVSQSVTEKEVKAEIPVAQKIVEPKKVETQLKPIESVNPSAPAVAKIESPKEVEPTEQPKIIEAVQDKNPQPATIEAIHQPKVKQMLEDLQIDSDKEHGVGEHRMEVPRSSPEKTIEELLINPGHDINMPLGEHIKFHFDRVKAEPELPAAVKSLEISTPAPLKNIPTVTSPDKVVPAMPAPLPSRITLNPLEIKTSDGIYPVAQELVVPTLTSPSPVMDRVANIPGRNIYGTSDGILPKRVMPDQLKQIVDQTRAPEGTELIKETIAKGIKKPGFFSRVFSRKKTPPTVNQSSVSPMMPRETINAIPTIQGRPQMTDVTFTPKLVTPVDELQSLSLQDFRRLSKDPLIAIKKISDKLELLSQESFRKKSDGIEALKKSALYSDYSAIMSESVMKGISYNQVIQEKKTLTEAEYQALMQLNKLLRS